MKQNINGKITSTGTYTVQATCPGCLPYVNTVTLTATARSKYLTGDGGFSRLYGKVSERFRNPFKFWVRDTTTGLPVAGTDVTYEVISRIDPERNAHAGTNGATMHPPSGQTGPYGGISFLTAGPSSGTYIVRARCEDCLDGQEAIAEGITYAIDVTATVEAVVAADPNVNESDCPSGCCPRTPVVRTRMAAGPNDGSFTSHNRENLVGLNVSALPACLSEHTEVTWQVADAPGDFIDSGTPSPQPTPGLVSSFRVFESNLPEAKQGRPLPLAYKVTASITRNGRTHTANAVVRQDEIDKCRQEYFDVSATGQDLRVAPYFDKYKRDKFTVGIDSTYVKYTDCFAHIFPQAGKAEVDRLRGRGFNINVTSGYRSARHNKRSGRKWNSVHQFGEAVDIQPASIGGYNSLNGHLIRPLWLDAGCPKILERRKMILNSKGK